MTDPVTALHYAPNANIVNGQYAPGVDGFNLADVNPGELGELPVGVKGLVWLGMTGGVTAAFEAAVNACIGGSNLYGFYLADEPDASAATAANLMAEADYIHAHLPGAETFMVEQNLGSDTSPVFYYTPANTHIDLFGLDPYPVQINVPNDLDYNIIPLAVSTAEADGIPQSDTVPVYQAFGGGGYSDWILPTAAQEQQILTTWGSVAPSPAFDYAYSWGTQDGDTAISDDPALQAVFAAHNAGTTETPPTLVIADPTLSVTAHGGSVNLGISVTAPASSTATTVTIAGLPTYETITDNFDRETFRGSSITLSEAEVDSGLTLTSHYRGGGDLSATLTITASDTIGGEISTSAPQTITVNDPPPSGSDALAMANKFSTFELIGTEAGFARGGAGHNRFAPMSSDLAAALQGDQNSGSYWTSRSDSEPSLFGLDIAAFAGSKPDLAFRG